MILTARRAFDRQRCRGIGRLLLAAALVAALAAVGVFDGWRSALAAAVAAVGLIATRVRFAAPAAVALVALVAVAASGQGG